MYKNFICEDEYLSKEDCKKIISDADSLLEIKEAGIGHFNTTDEAVRTSRIGWINKLKHDEQFSWLFGRVDEYTKLCNSMHFDIDYNDTGCEAIQYTTYIGADQGHYDYHMDHFMPGSWPDARKLTFVIQLTDPEEYEGGEFSLRDCADPIPKHFTKQGSLLIFPSILYHAVLPVTSGTRKSLVGWYRGPTWR